MDTSKLKESKALWFSISTAIIAALIYFAGVQKFINSISEAHLMPLTVAMVSGLSVFGFWAFAWFRVFKKSGIKMNFPASLETFMAGQFMNSITPLGQFGGEPVMAYLVRHNSDASYEKSISSVFSADILNATPFVTLTVAGASYLALFGSLNQRIRYGLYAALFLLFSGGVLMYLLWFKPGTVEGKILKLFNRFSRHTDLVERYISDIETKLDRVQKSFGEIGEDPLYLLFTAFFSHLGMLMQVATFYLVMYSLGFTPELLPAFFIVVFSSLASFTPTPGGSGAFEGVMAGMVDVFLPGVGFATGLTAAILFRICTYWNGIILGWLSFNKLHK